MRIAKYTLFLNENSYDNNNIFFFGITFSIVRYISMKKVNLFWFIMKKILIKNECEKLKNLTIFL